MGEGLTTCDTAVLTLLPVHFLGFEQFQAAHKALPPFGEAVGELCRMDLVVSSQGREAGEALPTRGAYMGLLPSMPSLVQSQEGGAAKTFPALRAGVASPPGLGSELLLPTEVPHTALVCMQCLSPVDLCFLPLQVSQHDMFVPAPWAFYGFFPFFTPMPN